MLSVVTMAASSSCRSAAPPGRGGGMVGRSGQGVAVETTALDDRRQSARLLEYADVLQRIAVDHQHVRIGARPPAADLALARSEEHTTELQSLMRLTSDALCFKKKKKTKLRQ